MQYHYPINEMFKPYVGVGVNYTIFSNADVDAPVVSTSTTPSDSRDKSVSDVALNEHWLMNVEVRYIEIGGDVDMNNANVGDVK